ncbi:MAG: hypothetical protein BWZ10_02047 [candidate division BRC1 bacterium ADurb.BinA364]|nr:MAG: hypothetical protein BWZ10_02047 [candidate division BRC1 bacterium ADurb.BinA364]
MGDERVGLHLFSTAGFLDDSWFNRTYWMYSARWPGFYIANQAPKTGQLLVFDDKRTYGVNAFTRRNRHSPFFFPETDGYLIFADDNDNEPILTGEPGGPEAVAWLRQNEYDSSRGTVDIAMPTFDKDKGIGFTRAKPPLWMSWVNVRARAMTLAHSGEGDGKTLFFAGPPDVLVPGDELAAFQGRAGGWLWAVSAADGETIARLQLDDAPVFDGMIAARDMLFMTTENGQILGFADPSVRTLIDPAKKAS